MAAFDHAFLYPHTSAQDHTILWWDALAVQKDKSPSNGSLVVLLIGLDSRTVTIDSVTDNASNTYSHAGTQLGQGSDALQVQIWYANNLSGRVPAVVYETYIALSGSTFCVAVGAEFTGSARIGDPLDQQGGNAVASLADPYNFDFGTLHPSSNNAIVVAAAKRSVLGGGTIDGTPGGMTEMSGTDGRFYTQWDIQTTAADQDGGISYNSSNADRPVCGLIVSFLTESVWVDIPDWHAHEYLDASAYPGGSARCLCDLWTTASSITVQARLVSILADGSVDAVVGTSAAITATTPTDATFAVTLTGNKQHKLQLTSDTPNTDLWCAPGAKVSP
jgi:hypothetical protein